MPDYRFAFAVPWEKPLLVCRKEHARGKVAAPGNDAGVPRLFRKGKNKALVFAKVRKIRIRPA